MTVLKSDEVVVVVDPISSDRRALQEGLEKMGYRVVTAELGTEAAEILESLDGEVRLVIADLNATAHDGTALAVAVKKHHPRIGMVLTSGLPLDPARIHHRGADAFLRKPVRPDELTLLVARSVHPRGRGRPEPLAG